jgi:hypothetical protein
MIEAIAHNFHLPITSEATLKDFVRIAWGVNIPDVQVCANHTTPWRAFADAYFARYPVTVWHGSRGFAGKSFTLATLGLTEAVTLKADVNILGGSGAQSKRVLDHENTLWHYRDSPRNMLDGDAATITRLSNGAKIEALMASQASVRGPHPQRLLLDEIDEMDLSILEAAQGQPMSRNGIPTQTVMSSTRQYRNGTMQKILERAREKGWKVYTWCYKETMQPHGWLAQSEVETKRSEVTTKMWETEYENQEPSSESKIFDNIIERTITDEEIAQFDNILQGIDWGFSPDPFSWGKMHYDAGKRKLYIFDEYRQWRQSNRDTYDYLVKEKNYKDNQLIIADSNDSKSVGDYRNYGANCRAAEKKEESRKYSYKWLQALKSIVIDPERAPYHAKEFRDAEHPRTKDGEIISEYPQVNDHAIDDTRYATNLIWRQGGQ